jgi:choline dehydrogenase-like flavoprotein
VQNILFADVRGGKQGQIKLAAKGVRTTGSSGASSDVYTTMEVIFAAGSVYTPKLLQFSGIGPKSILDAAGIQVKYALDAVGSDFQDHPFGTVIYNTTTDTVPTPNSMTNNATFQNAA